MNILDFDFAEHEESILAAESAGIDLGKELEKSYQSLMFLGSNINAKDSMLLEMAIFNIRLCFVYYSKHEDYRKLAALKELATIIDTNGGSNVSIDKSLIDEIDINLN